LSIAAWLKRIRRALIRLAHYLFEVVPLPDEGTNRDIAHSRT